MELVNLAEALGYAGTEVSYQQWRVWELTFQSQRLPYRLIRRPTGVEVWIPLSMLEATIREIRLIGKEADEVEALFEVLTPTKHVDWTILALVMGCLVLFHFLVHATLNSQEWILRGCVQSTDMLTNGTWYRAITALTIHADLLHLFGNVLFGSFYAYLLFQRIEQGFAWGLILLSGIFGNVLNVFFHGHGHISIGASTAVFGTLGILIGYRMFQLNFRWFHDFVIPLVAGVVLFGFFGVGDENTDVGAHLFGLLSGLVLGFLAKRWLLKQEQLPKIFNPLVGWGALLLIVLAWVIAFFV